MRDPNTTIPVGDRTLPPEFTAAPRSGRQALLETYGAQAEELYQDFHARGCAAFEAGAVHLSIALFEAAAFWRRVMTDQEVGADLVLVDEVELMEASA